MPGASEKTIARITNLEELRRTGEAARRSLAARRATDTTIYVGMGTCGIAAGARATLAALTEELARRGIETQIETVGCIGICVREPLVDIQQAGKPRITYGNVTPQMMPRIVEEHLVKGTPVKQWVVGRLLTERGRSDGWGVEWHCKAQGMSRSPSISMPARPAMKRPRRLWRPLFARP